MSDAVEARPRAPADLKTDEAPPSGAERARRRGRIWPREPLARFFILGALIFCAAGLLDGARERASQTIAVDQSTVERLAARYKVEMGFAPTHQQLKALVDRYVSDEALYREAVRLHLQEDDEIVRRRLVQKMQFLDADLGVAAAPSEEALRTYYSANPARFANPPSVDFRHLYFDPDKGGADEARRRADQALHALAGGADWGRLGDRFPLQSEYRGVGHEDLVQLFGDTPVSSQVLADPVQRWSGPVKSGYGWHLVFVERRRSAQTPPYDQIRDRVRLAFLEDARARSEQQAQARLLSRYEITLPAGMR